MEKVVRWFCRRWWQFPLLLLRRTRVQGRRRTRALMEENGGGTRFAQMQFCVEMVVAPPLLQMEMHWWIARCCRCGGEKMEEDGIVMVSAMVVRKGAGTSMVATGVAGEGGVRDGAVGREKKMVALRGGRRDWRRRLCGGWKGN